MATSSYPDALDPEKVGTYPALAKAGGGYVWDAVLEYRVWCHPERGAPNVEDGSDYYYAFATYEEASNFAKQTPGSKEPLALVLQEEYISEEEPGQYLHIRERRVTEWPVIFLRRPRRTSVTIPNFLAQDAPANRLDILRGLTSDA
jgi:putative acetyltransferase